MDIITNIILGALGNGLYDVVVKGVKRLSQPSKLDKFLSDRHWKRLYEQAGLIDRVERYRSEGSQDALVEVGRALEKALQSEEFASLASDVQAILTSQEELRNIMGAGFLQVLESQDEIKEMLRQMPGSVTISIGTINIQMDPGAFVPALAELDREAFVAQVEEIYRITGHEVQRDVIIGGEKLDISAALPMTLGRPKQITYVRCVHDHEVIRQEMNNFRQVLADAPRATGMMVSQHGFESGAMELSEKHSIVALTYDQLVSEIIDFSSYLDKCMRNYAQQGVEYGVPLKKLYVEQDIIEDVTGKKYPLRDYVKDWLADDSQNLLVILGDFGIGKTSYTLKLASELAEKRKLEKAGIIPVRIELKNYRETLSYEKMLVNHLLEHKVTTTSNDAFDFLLRTGEVLLMLDAFDEMAVQVNELVTKANFGELYKAVKGKAKVILTCRTHYFREHPEVESLIYDIHAPEGFRTPGGTALYRSISGRKNCKICFLLPFDYGRLLDSDGGKVGEYLHKALGKEKEDALKMLNKNWGMRDLATRPVLLSMIAQSFRELSKMGDISSTAALYEVYIQKWIERDDIRTNLTKEGKEKFAEVLASKLWLENRERIHYSELRPLVEQHFKSKIRVPLDAEYAEHEVRTASFLTRDMEGNYRFAHKSFMEFFLAQKFAEEIKGNRIIDFAREEITIEVADFLAGMIKDEGSLYALIRNKPPEEVGYVCANVVSVLKAIKKGNLAGADFSNCVLSNANFFEISSWWDYYGNPCSLAGADFSNAYIDGIYLPLYDFSRIDLSPDGKYIAVSGHACVSIGGRSRFVFGGGVSVLDSADFHIVKEIESKNSVDHAAYSPDGKYIIVAGHNVIILDSSDFFTVKKVNTKYDSYHVNYSPDGKHVVVSGRVVGGWGVTILDSSDFSIVAEIDKYNSDGFTYSPGGEYIIYSDRNGVTILDSSDFSIVRKVNVKFSVSRAIYSPGREYIIVGGYVNVGTIDFVNIVNVLDSSDFSIVKEIEIKHSMPNITYSPGGEYIVFGGRAADDSGGVTILDSSNFSIIKEMETECIFPITAYSPDMKYIVVCGDVSGEGKEFVGDVTILDSSDFSIVQKIKTRCAISNIKYTVDGRHIILSGEGIGGITILDGESFQIVKEIARVANDVKGMKIDGAKGLDPVLEEALRRAI